MSGLLSAMQVSIPEKMSDWPLASLYDATTGPIIPIGTAIAYFITVHLLNPKAGENRKPLARGAGFTALVFLHSTYKINRMKNVS
jgi:hypothetical protein